VAVGKTQQLRRSSDLQGQSGAPASRETSESFQSHYEKLAELSGAKRTKQSTTMNNSQIFNQLQAKQGKKDFGAAGVTLVTNYKSANFTGACLVVFYNKSRENADGTKGAWESPWGTNDGPPKHMDAVDTARDELFEETSSLIYCPRCILEHSPCKEITSSKWVFGLRVDESKLSRKQFKQNRGTLEGLTRTGRKIGCMLEMSRMAFIPLKQLEDNAHKLEKDCTELVQDIDGKVSESSRTTCSRQV
jgi:hypothetical protein